MIRTRLTEALPVVIALLLLATAAMAQSAAPPPAPRSLPRGSTVFQRCWSSGRSSKNRGAIGLPASQVEALERLSLDFIREATC